MADLNRNLPRIDASRFSMVPRADIPRSTFVTTHSHKTTFHSNYLIPIHIDEVLPADTHQADLTIFARLATPLFPIMDGLELETFFFFVPARILWDNWVRMMGERTNPNDSISYVVPHIDCPLYGWPALSIGDYMGIPEVPSTFLNALPFRAYNLIWNDWFRDENLQNSLPVDKDDGPDLWTDYPLQKRNKRHDYFTSALPWPIKGGVSVPMPLTGNALVRGLALPAGQFGTTSGTPGGATQSEGPGNAHTAPTNWAGYFTGAALNDAMYIQTDLNVLGETVPYLYADLTTASGATLNALRLAIQTQRLLERDARSGSRYTELLQAHFGVQPQDARLQRPEYIGGGRTTIQTQAIAQTSNASITGSDMPLGTLGAAATATDRHSYSYNATEHGYILGLVNVRAELTYQQGRHRLWTRKTRYDFYWPVFAQLGEQAIRLDEIFLQVDADSGFLSVPNASVFGYQERWAEYRHRPSRISGMFRSTATLNIDEWHLAQQFPTPPALNSTFITEDVPLARVLAAGTQADGQQILFDSVFQIRTTRAMPTYSVPGMMDHF